MVIHVKAVTVTTWVHMLCVFSNRMCILPTWHYNTSLLLLFSFLLLDFDETEWPPFCCTHIRQEIVLLCLWFHSSLLARFPVEDGLFLIFIACITSEEFSSPYTYSWKESNTKAGVFLQLDLFLSFFLVINFLCGLFSYRLAVLCVFLLYIFFWGGVSAISITHVFRVSLNLSFLLSFLSF